MSERHEPTAGREQHFTERPGGPGLLKDADRGDG